MSDLKAKLRLGKKVEDAELDESENLENESPSRQDKTDSTDISDLGDEISEDDSFVGKLKSKLTTLRKKSSKKDNEDENEESGAAKKKIKPIYIIIALGLLVILFSDEIFPPEPDTTEVATSFKRPIRKKPVKPEVPVEAPKSEDSTVPTEAPVETPTETPTETPAETAPTEISTETTPDSPVDVTSVETPPAEEPPTETLPTEEPIIETTVEPTDPAPEETVAVPSDATISDSVDSIDGEEAPKNDDNLTDQILQDLEKQAKDTKAPEPKTEYVTPPNYEYQGRGLVYNCLGKHWACVDGPSYKQCEDNASSSKYLNRPVECHPFNVYEGQKGCEIMQNRMVSSSTKTEFCNE